MRRSRGGLATRVLALAVGLVALTALLTGLATVGFAQRSAREEQRSELAAQASLVALQSARLVTPRALARVARGLDGSVLAVYAPGGGLLLSSAPRRRALRAATAAAAARAVVGAAVTTEVRVRGRAVLVEARPTSDGGAIVLTRPVAVLTPTTTGFIGGVLAVLAACLLVAVLTAVLLARRITGPLAQTAAAARRLARGERGIAVPASGTAEVADVGDALRALDTALGVSEGRQREFLLSISHELRTPLTALRGYGEALADGVVGPDRTREIGGVLVTETARLDRFTADLLELARLEADDFSLQPGPVDLGGVADAAVVAWRARAEAARVGLASSGFETPVVVEGDARRIRQVLDGLIENALRATPSEGSVLLLAVRDDGVGGVAVQDTGPGLSEEDLAEAFTRGLLRERYRETRPVGTGLGLSIATRLATRMGGRVTAGAAEVLPGARFVLELPLHRGLAEPDGSRRG